MNSSQPILVKQVHEKFTKGLKERIKTRCFVRYCEYGESFIATQQKGSDL
jgi:hypothetical protein